MTRRSSVCAALVVGLLAGCVRAAPPTATPSAPPAATQSVSTVAAATSTAASPTQPPPTATAAPTPAPPKLPIVIALDREPETLHPFYARSIAAQTVSAAWHLGCISADSHAVSREAFFVQRFVPLGCEPPEPPRLVGDAGSSGAHYVARFVIRKDWMWTDGKPVTAQDAIFAWKFIMHPDAQIRDRLTQSVYRMVAVDENTVDVQFMSAAQAAQAAEGRLRGEVPFEYFSQWNDYEPYARQTEPLLPDDYALVLRWLPAHTMQGIAIRDHLKPRVIAPALRGDGPFALGTWNAGRDIVLNRIRNKGEGAETLMFRFVSNPGASVDQNQANIGMPTTVTAGTGMVVAGPELRYLAFNVARPALGDEATRNAIGLAINAPEIATSLNLTRSWAVGTASSVPAAIQALEALGWRCAPSCERFVPAVRGVRNAFTDTLRITLTVPADDDTGKAIAVLAQTNLRQVGIAAFVQQVERAQLLALPKDGGVIANRNWDVLVTKADLPMQRLPSTEFACVGTPPKPAAQNVTGWCTAADGVTESDLWRLAVERGEVLPIGRPSLRLPITGVTGLDYGGFGPVTWNARAWKN